jgi:tetratricopeptide (TPR) repeat protein
MATRENAIGRSAPPSKPPQPIRFFPARQLAMTATLEALCMDNNIEKAKALFFDALALFERSNYEAAEIKLREALTFAPTSVPILTNLAVALQRQEKYEEARTQAERAVESNSTNLEALLVLADCYANEEKHTEALRIFDRVISIDPRLPDVHKTGASYWPSEETTPRRWPATTAR